MTSARHQVIGEFLRTRSPQAADTAVAVYWPLLQRWIRSYCTTRDISDDLLQVAACGLLKSLARYDPRRASFDTYARHCVLGEVRHYLRDHGAAIQVPRSMRERGRAPVIRSLDELTDGTTAGYPRGQIGRDEPGLARAEDRAQLWELLRDLDARQGAALLLWVGFQVPQVDIAALLGVPQNTVSRLCTRALRALRMRAGTTSARLRSPTRRARTAKINHFIRVSWGPRKPDGLARLRVTGAQLAIKLRPLKSDPAVDSAASMAKVDFDDTIRRGAWSP
jgi:RNA polymerase sigma-B factor